MLGETLFLCLGNLSYRLTIENTTHIFKVCILKEQSAVHAHPWPASRKKLTDYVLVTSGRIWVSIFPPTVHSPAGSSCSSIFHWEDYAFCFELPSPLGQSSADHACHPCGSIWGSLSRFIDPSLLLYHPTILFLLWVTIKVVFPSLWKR